MKPDRDIQQHVLSALEFEPSLDAGRIGVAVTDGLVTLTGLVPSAAERQRAEHVTRDVHGVRAVANDLLVEVDPAARRGDAAIAEAATQALEWNSEVPARSVKVSVRDGWVTLTGDVEWRFQRNAAQYAVTNLVGVRGVLNSLEIRPRVRPHDVTVKIEEAFRRSADIEASRVHVETSADGSVTLSGTVRTLREREQAEHAAWSAPGVTRVEDRIVVGP